MSDRHTGDTVWGGREWQSVLPTVHGSYPLNTDAFQASVHAILREFLTGFIKMTPALNRRDLKRDARCVQSLLVNRRDLKQDARCALCETQCK